MKEERMKILELIEKKIITAQEGVELLAVLKNGESTREKIDSAVKKTGDFASSAKDMICEFAKEKEPVVKATLENIAAVAGDVATEIGKAIRSVISSDDPVETDKSSSSDLGESYDFEAAVSETAEDAESENDDDDTDDDTIEEISDLSETDDDSEPTE